MSIFKKREMENEEASAFIPRMTPVVKWLIIINVAIFFANGFFPASSFGYPIQNESIFDVWGIFSGELALSYHQYWRFISYQFLHASLGHVAFNMFALWVFGPLVEVFYGKWKFLLYYLACGIGGAIFYLLLGHWGLLSDYWYYIGMVGASGSIYGVIAACALLAPDARVQMIFPPIELSMRQFSLVILAIACCYIYFEWNNAGGEAGHMGGMFVGFIITALVLLFKKTKKSFIFNPTPKKSDYPRRLQKEENIPHPSNEEVDAILEKIGKEGLDSLTEKERAVLQRAAKR